MEVAPALRMLKIFWLKSVLKLYRASNVVVLGDCCCSSAVTCNSTVEKSDEGLTSLCDSVLPMK